MKDIFELRFTVTGYLKDGKQRCKDTGCDIESVGKTVAEAFELDVVRVVTEVEE